MGSGKWDCFSIMINLEEREFSNKVLVNWKMSSNIRNMIVP
jgi:hypothetical protein